MKIHASILGISAVGVSLLTALLLPSVPSKDKGMQEQIRSAIAQSLNAVAAIKVDTAQGEAYGSGFFLESSGINVFITAAHLVKNTTSIKIKLRSNPDHEVLAKVLQISEELDLASLELMELAVTAAPITALRLAKKSSYQIGDFVFAIGSPSGYPGSTSFGIISALDRYLMDPQSKNNFLQVDITMRAGSSGGPVINLAGEVIGLSSRGDLEAAFGFAVPADDIRDFLQSTGQLSVR